MHYPTVGDKVYIDTDTFFVVVEKISGNVVTGKHTSIRFPYKRPIIIKFVFKTNHIKMIGNGNLFVRSKHTLRYAHDMN